jgi:hypothetical protein
MRRSGREPDQPDLPFDRTIQERFEEFHAAHPEVYTYLLALAREVRHKGYKRYGIGALWERLRWHFQIEEALGEDFKLNNDFRSRYARKLMQEQPELDGFFEIRELQAA